MNKEYYIYLLTNKNFGMTACECLIAIVLGTVVASSSLFISMIVAYIWGHLHEMNQEPYLVLLGSFFLSLVGFVGFSYLNELFIKSLNTKVVWRVFPGIWNHLLSLPIKIVKKFTSGDLVQRLIDYESVLAMLVAKSLSIVFDGVALIFLLGYMMYQSLTLAIFYLVFSIVLLSIKCILLPKNIQCMTSRLVECGNLSSFLNETLLQIHKIRSANREDRVYKKWLSYLLKIKHHERYSVKIEIAIIALESLFPAFLFLSCGIIFYVGSVVSTPILLSLMICGGQFSLIFEKMSAEIILLLNLLPALARMQPIMNEAIEVTHHKKSSISVEGKISLSHVYFHHNETGKHILQDISMEIEAGQFVAIIGPSGAGKSSIFNLLLGFDTPSAGTITIDNHLIADINMREIRKQWGVVLQTTQLLPGTLFSNIAANTNITLEEAWQLAQVVGLDEDIRAMPMKMYTHISDNPGESISGGQKQKIVIARALATQPKLLLLDEATSALDNKSQALIYENLKAMSITRLVIAHRYSTIVDADVVYVMEQGKMVDRGSYRELRDKNVVTV